MLEGTGLCDVEKEEKLQAPVEESDDRWQHFSQGFPRSCAYIQLSRLTSSLFISSITPLSFHFILFNIAPVKALFCYRDRIQEREKG